ncbi:MAG TPA: protein kinase [Candidatus Sulfopaludibacter sp.]|nr:protein kinase [Candidatus Sulfopaludibacter sp.]
MTQERWKQIETVYQSTLEQDPLERGAFLSGACGRDHDLRTQVESLLARDPSSPENFLNQSVWDTQRLTTGARLGPYEILESLGAGGMGEVWKAHDTRLGRTVALKVSRFEFNARFEREARAVAALNHPNICTLHDVGPNYFVMEFVDGRPLRELIPRKGLALGLVLNYAAQIADALAAAHASAIVHRDLKPGNILVTPEGRIKVVDFGLARVGLPHAPPPDDSAISGAGLIAGTVSYMSPEQAQGRTVDARSDIFSFGSVLYEMLTGARAFPGDSPMTTLAAILHNEPRPASELTAGLPREVESLLARCLRKDPARRWQNMADVKAALLDLKEDSDAGRSAGPPPSTSLRKRRWPLIAAILLPLAGIVVGAIWEARRNPPQEVWSGTVLSGPIIASHPRISPDGQLLAFRAIVDGLSQVAVMKPDAASWTVLTRDRDQGAVESLAWAADGSRIYFDREGAGGIYAVPPLGGVPRLVVENAAAPEALPDATLIVLRPASDGRRQLFHFWPESGRMEALPARVSVADSRQFAVFPDGKEIAVIGFYGPAGDRRLFILDIASGQARDLPELQELGGNGLIGSGRFRSPQTLAISFDGQSVLILWNRNDSKLLASQARDGSRRGRVLMSFPFLSAPLSFDAAPDGSLYVDQSAHDSTVDTIARSGKILSEATLPKYAFSAVLLPGGGFVYAVVAGGRSQLLTQSPGGDPHPLFNTNEPVRFPGAWLGNGRFAFVIGSGEQTRMAVGSIPDGRILQRIPFNAERVTAVSASPDGQTIYCASEGAIWSQPISGGAPRKIGEGFDVMADPLGKRLYLLRAGSGGNELWRMDVTGGDVQRVHVPAGYRLAPGWLSPAAANADGRILLTVNAPGLFFYQAAILDPERGAMSLVPAPPQAVISNPGWAGGGTIQLLATRWTSTLWRYRAGR